MPSRMWKKPSLVKRSAAWCQRGSSSHDARIAVDVEGALGVAGGDEPHHDVDPQAEPGQARADGEARLVRLDVVGEGDVEQPVLPVEGGVLGQPRAGQAGLRLLVAGKRLVRGQRDAGGGDPRPASGWPFSNNSTKSPIQSVAASSSVGWTRARSRNPFSRTGTSMSRIALSGARTRKVRVRPSGFRKVWTVTSLGISWAPSWTPSARATTIAAARIRRTGPRYRLVRHPGKRLPGRGAAPAGPARSMRPTQATHQPDGGQPAGARRPPMAQPDASPRSDPCILAEFWYSAPGGIRLEAP